MRAAAVRISPDWLALREPSDASARALGLVERLRQRPPASGRWLIHDLGCGTGSMARWLAPLLPGAQHWVMHDHDPDLLALAAASPPGPALDGASVTVEVRQSDITRLRPGDLAGADLITASALLDILTENELAGLSSVWAAARARLLLTLTVVGHVELSPSHPIDARVAAAFNAHQRRGTAHHRLLGPAAVAATEECLRALGNQVAVLPSPWRLGAQDSDLAAEWFAGWVGAAREQQPKLAPATDGYLRRRLAEAAAGALEVTVGHADLLALPG